MIFLNRIARQPLKEYKEASPPKGISLALNIIKKISLLGFYAGRLTIKATVLPPVVALTVVAACAVLISGLSTSTLLKRHSVAALAELTSLVALIWNFGSSGLYSDYKDLKTGASYVVIKPTMGQSQNKTPIIYAPGYLELPENLIPSAQKLADKIHAPVYLLQYRSLFQSIERHSEDIASLAEQVLDNNKIRSIYLLGHSMGGLVTGYSVAKLQEKNVRVKGWVTIASPLEGTRLADWSLGICGKQMMPNSEFIRDFKPPNVPSLHIQTQTDWIVPGSHSLPSIFVEGQGHLSICSAEATLYSVAHFYHMESQKKSSST